MKEDTKIILKAVTLMIALIAIIVVFWQPLHGILSDRESISQFLDRFGRLAGIGFILLTALQVLLAPVPGQFIGLASGYLFGPWLGTLYCMVGLILGSALVFWLSRRYGRPFITLFMKCSTVDKLDKKIEKHGLMTLFMIYLLPALPDDAICFVAGLTRIRIPTLVLVSAIGRLPGFVVLNFVGDIFASDNMILGGVVFGSAMLVSIVGYIYREKLERLMMSLVQKVGR